MTAMAILLKEAGHTVGGCDIDEVFITDKSLGDAGIYPQVGFSKEHIIDSDLVITTGAHGGFENPEVRFAKEKGIPVLTQGEAVGKSMDGSLTDEDQIGISVAGTHGKTTTTAIIATIFSIAGLDPSYIIGTSEIFSLPSPGHFGKGKYFIAEADEYATKPTHDKTPKFLWQNPRVLVITNIELDHPDIYSSVEAVRDVFLQFAAQLPADSLLVQCLDSEQLRLFYNEYPGKKITYGIDRESDYFITKYMIKDGKTNFELSKNGTVIDEFTISTIGQHMALNATAAIIVALKCDIPLVTIKKGLVQFKGSKRRLEYKGQLAYGGMSFDDYAHHPTEIKATLRAFKDAYPNKKIIAVFQPHTYSRTKKLFSDFVGSFSAADSVFLVPIYPSLRESADESISSAMLYKKMREDNSDVTLFSSLDGVVQYVESKRFESDIVLVTLGAGDIYTIWEALIVE